MLDERYVFCSPLETRHAFVKIGSSEALSNMNNGVWWLRHPAYFQYEDLIHNDKERGDDEDSIIKEQHVFEERLEESLTSCHACIPPQTIKHTYKMYRSQNQINNERILCFYRLDISPSGEFPPIDERLKRFGEYCAFVDIEQLIYELKKTDNTIKGVDISYYSDSYSGPVGESYKRNNYKHQNEFRIYSSASTNGEQIDNDSAITELYDLVVEEEQKTINSELTTHERFKAEDNRKCLRVELCKLLSNYKNEIHTEKNLLTDPLSIMSIIEARNIEDISI